MNRSLPLLGALATLLVTGCGSSTSPTTPTDSTGSSQSAFSEAAFREAARVTATALIDVRTAARPGLYERDIKTVIDATFQRLGSGAPAFSHIVASGPNTVIVHYFDDGRQLTEGDLVLVDIGATSNGHCADVTRMFAVSGHFAARQQELFDLVLGAHRAIRQRARPGVDSISGLGTWTKEYFRQSPLRALDSAGAEQTMDRFFTYSVGHYVGRSVHGEDTGWDAKAPLQAGQVLAIEPGLYLPAEAVGVRVEDTFLVTSQGLECLSCESQQSVDLSPASPLLAPPWPGTLPASRTAAAIASRPRGWERGAGEPNSRTSR